MRDENQSTPGVPVNGQANGQDVMGNGARWFVTGVFATCAAVPVAIACGVDIPDISLTKKFVASTIISLPSAVIALGFSPITIPFFRKKWEKAADKVDESAEVSAGDFSQQGDSDAAKKRSREWDMMPPLC